MELRFDDRTVLVTGASSGIGAAVAVGFGAAGAEVAVHFRHHERAATSVLEAVRAGGGSGYLVRGDLAAEGGPEELLATVASRSGRLDVLVNNAGAQLRRARIEETDDDLYAGLVSVNLTSVFRCCRAAIPLLRQSGHGAIVNLSSISARNGGGGGSVVYASTKAAVATLTRGLAKELAADGIRVNAVAPGLIETPFHEATPRATWESSLAGIPMGRAGRAEECVGPVLFLASETAASYVTGQSLEVNGAQLMP